MLESVEPMQAEIEGRLSEPTAVIAIDTAEFNLSPYIKEIIVSPNGAIAVQGGKSGQMFMLIPTKVDGTLSWRCIGGTYDTMPPTCRTASHFTPLSSHCRSSGDPIPRRFHGVAATSGSSTFFVLVNNASSPNQSIPHPNLG